MRTVNVLLIAIAASSGVACSSSSAAPATDPADAVTVQVARVEAASWPALFEAGGVVVARETAAIASRVLAPVAKVRVRPGDRVRRGQVLLELDAADLSAAASRATAAAAAAAHAATAAEADVVSEEARLTAARTAHERIARLFGDKSATAQERDDARALLDVAEARHRAALARVAAARAELGAARAGDRSATVTASFATLTAPFDGVVTERSIDPGAMAMPGMPLLVIENQASYRFEARLDAGRIQMVRVGDVLPVRLDVTAGDGPWTDARVSEVSRVDPDGHSFAVKLDLPAIGPWRSGLVGRAELHGPSRHVLAVPTDAVLHRGQLSYVFVVTPDSRARLRAVSTGATSGGKIEILDGLTAGEPVVSPVPGALKDGAAIAFGGRS